MNDSRLLDAVRWLALTLGSAIFLFPLWWMVVVSLETPDRAGAAVTGSAGLDLWPDAAQWRNYATAIRETGSRPWVGFLDALANSIVITVLVVIGTVLSSSLVGYAFARLRFRGNRLLFLVMLADRLGIDLLGAASDKLHQNATRFPVPNPSQVPE